MKAILVLFLGFLIVGTVRECIKAHEWQLALDRQNDCIVAHIDGGPECSLWTEDYL